MIIRGSFEIFPESFYFWEIQCNNLCYISFKITHLCSSTLLQATVKLLEIFILWKPFQLYHFILSVRSVTKTLPLQWWFQSTEQVIISGTRIRREWGMLHCHIPLPISLAVLVLPLNSSFVHFIFVLQDWHWKNSGKSETKISLDLSLICV